MTFCMTESNCISTCSVEAVRSTSNVKSKVDNRMLVEELSNRVLEMLADEIESDCLRGASFKGFSF